MASKGALTVQDKQSNLKMLLLKALPSIQGIASERLDPEKLLRIALVAASRNQRLLDCTPQSILSSLMQAATVGLEPETPLQHAYLIPRKNRHTQTLEATFQPSYKGLLLVAMRGGDLSAVWTRVVYEGEYFKVKYGTTEEIAHTPIFEDAERGRVVAVYAVAKLKDGVTKFEVMTTAQVEAIRARASVSTSGGSSPWDTDWEQMAAKTVLKRVLKQIPTENEKLAKAIEADEDSGERAHFADVVPLTLSEESATRTEVIKEDLKKKASAAPPAAANAAMTADEQAAIKAEEAAQTAQAEKDRGE